MTARAASTSATSRTFGVLLACLLLLLGLGLGLLLLAPEGYRHGTPHAHLIHQSLLGGAHGSGSHREQHQRELRRQHVCVAEDPLPNVPQRTSLFPFTWASAKGKAGAQALGTAGSKEQARDSSSYSGSMAALRDQYSIWAQARGRTGEQLRSEIAHLAARHPPAPVFLPHVTVLGDIDGPREEVVRVARELAQQVKKYRVNFTGVTRGSLYYQCVYLGVANDQPVMEAAAAARRAYGMTTGPYMPHLSLLYSDMDESERAKVVEYETGRLYGEGSGYDTLLADPGFEVSHFSVWYTPVADKSCESWCLVEEVELA